MLKTAATWIPPSTGWARLDRIHRRSLAAAPDRETADYD